MRGKKSYIPYKVILGYLLLLVLVSVTGYLIYSENAAFSSTENKVQLENKKILKVSTLFSKMYETESQARLTILSNSDKDYQNYIAQTNELKLDIDTLKTLLTTKYQIVLLDIVKYLLNKKTNNIQQLKIIKNKASEEIAVKNAINDLTKMEVSLQKLRLEDFVKNPATLGEYQRSVLVKYVDYLNQNIPSDDTNTLSQKALDSMLTKSRKLLTDVKRETSIRNENLNKEEKKLLENELSASEQLRKIIRLIENEILIKNTQNSAEKEASLKKTNEVVSSAAIIGLLLTILFSVLVLSDFSKSQSYKKQLEQANLKTKNLLRNREQLIATVSHDLKTPLNTIIGYSELLTTSGLSTKQSYFTKNIKTASDYIAHLVQDLVDLTQIEAGKIALESSAFSLTELLTETAQNIQSNYDSKKIELQFDLDEKLQQNIISDSFRIKQIITNIIGNAYKFTEVGYIKISAKVNTENTKVSVYIEDSGIGIETSKQDLIFEEFTQANDSIEKKYGGTGLGLTISKKLAQILGGNLFLKSTVNKGSTFTITIPIFEAIQKPKLNNPKEFLASDFTIIILDDDANLLQLTNEILKQKGFQTVTFTNGTDALQFAKQTPFDLVVTDIQMPEMDGFEFLMQLQKEDNLFKNQPIIAITGRTDLPNSDYFIAGFKTVIAKPYLPENFLEIIKNVLQNSGNLKTILTASVYQETNHTLYSLDNLKAFFPDESNVIQEILVSFITNTKVNQKLIEQFCSENNLDEIKEIAHKMYP
jgi:signal transduction histidine kinase/DNA-binding response OmpR family regulator